MNQKDVKSVFLIGPNYAAGKDMLDGVEASFKGQIVGRELTAWPNQVDFSGRAFEGAQRQAGRDLCVLSGRPRHPVRDAVRAVRHAGIDPALQTFTIDELSLPRLKDHAVGIPGVQHWVNDLPNAANKRFVADYKAKYKISPSFYGSQTYDAVPLIDSALKITKGDMSNKDALRRALEKADFKSVRGNFKFGPNHIPIQDFYLQEVVKDGSDFRLKTVETIVENDQDVHHTKCKMPN